MASSSLREWLFYVAVGAGMALSTSAFAMMSGLFAAAPLGMVLVALVAAALLCTVIALSIGELASMWPSSPAILTYFRMAFGSRAALVLVHLYLVFVVLIAGVESYSFAVVFKAAVPAAPETAIICLLLLGVIAVNLRGLELPRRMQIVTAFGAMAIIAALGALALLEAGPQATQSTASELGELAALPAAVGLAIFLFTGFEWVTPVGLSRGAYARKIPLSMLIAIGALLITYALFALGVGLVLPRQAAAAGATPQVAFFAELLGPTGVYIALLLTLAAIFSTFNAGIMGGARLLQAMGREGSLPAWTAVMNLETGAPVGAVLFLGTLGMASSLIVSAFGLYLVAAVIGSAMICIIYAAYLLAVERLRRKRPDHSRPFRPRVPAGLRWPLIVAMPLIGAATLVSLPELGLAPLVPFVGALLLVAALAEYSERRMRSIAPPSRAAGLRRGKAAVGD
jgi:ethanolamine permease